ncbi:MAG TPA: type I-B CRISPR-associated protein Cas5 [Thermotogaceae bacterium]|nr:type I-B CRISPR-associated protein Cas5 [Thermotogaceae bacterium]
MKILQIHLRAPTAHFAIPFAMSIKRTFPIPMYSTAIGIVCNALKYKEKIEKFLTSQFSMAIIGDYGSMQYEYTWLRSFSLKHHKRRFPGKEDRRFMGEVEHPGGQMPNVVSYLLDADFRIYVKAPLDILKMIMESFLSGDWITHLHAGRAEDIIDFFEVDLLDIQVEKIYETNGYTWIPSPEFADLDFKDYESLFNTIGGSIFLVSTIYKVSNGKRHFERIRAKLYNGGIPLINFKPVVLPAHNERPLFFARMVKE